MEELLPPNAVKLLHDLQSHDAYVRKTAAEELGRLKIADERVLNTLEAVAGTDANQYVRKAAAESYLALAGKPPSQEPSPASTGQPVPGDRAGARVSTYAPSAHSSSDYAALRGIASLCTGISQLMLVVAGLGVIGGLLITGDSVALGVGIAIASAAAGAINYTIFRALAETILVTVDIEANTRQAATSLQRLAAVLDQRLR